MTIFKPVDLGVDTRLVSAPLLSRLSAAGLLASLALVTRARRSDAGGRGAADEPGFGVSFRGLVEDCPSVLYVQTYDRSRFEYISPQLDRLLGSMGADRQPSLQAWMAHIHSHDRARVQACFAAAAADGVATEIEYRVVPGSGAEPIWVRDKAHLVNDLDRPTRYWHGVISDITAERETQRQLAQTEQRFRAIIEHSPVGFYTQEFDAESPGVSRTTYVSPTHAEQLGFDPEAILANPTMWLDQVHPDDLLRVIEEDIATNTGSFKEFTTDYRMLRPDGQVVWMRDSAQLVDIEGVKPYWQGFLLDITRQKTLEQELDFLASHDGLTRLPNRRYFDEALRLALARAERSGLGVVALFVDLDGFKQVNDLLGHAAGDRVLEMVATRLRATLRSADLVARQGGDEFLVLAADIAGTPSGEDSTRVAKKLRDRIALALNDDMTVDGTLVRVGASVGVAIYPRDADDADRLLAHADAAMYRAKDTSASSPARTRLGPGPEARM